MSKVYKDICPCKDCDKRTAECHSICKKYKEWKDCGTEIPKFEFAPLIDYSKKNTKKKYLRRKYK